MTKKMKQQPGDISFTIFVSLFVFLGFSIVTHFAFRSDEKLANWSNHWIQLLKNFQSYIKDMHTVGLSWNKDVSINFFMMASKFLALNLSAPSK